VENLENRLGVLTSIERISQHKGFPWALRSQPREIEIETEKDCVRDERMHDLRKSGNKSTVFNAWIREGSQQVSQLLLRAILAANSNSRRNSTAVVRCARSCLVASACK